MINRIISYSVSNKLIIGLMTLALIVGGIWSMTKVPIDAVPDITNNQVQVITQSPNLATEDIEQFVTFPVELAMANLPGVLEIRSVSRFGLSLVTIVFEDEMGTYLPRQLVAEKLAAVANDIPNGFGRPSMGPISTGLGEIYQYSLEVADDYKDQYSTTDLRVMQDWIIKRQMAMVPGVVEVNSFGGSIRQYEVAVDPDELNAIGITISDIFKALERNNQNTGGAYIEKDHMANFIRGEGLARSLEDIENIVVTNINNLPITISDVAKVQYGTDIRYGAFTKNGEGEAVGGMIMMLKGANSNEVIRDVKKRVNEIQKSLPDGVTIKPFLDRSELISQTTSTVGKNLIEGALIVIFVLVFLLGNWRGGLIVASTIPLSLLFAFILMNVFDVWANLMSLGAIDFGIIVDGAVIIVESTVFLLNDKVLKHKKLTGALRNEAALAASGKMMNSAFFGQLIILIVFIPILALQGVEGKMFQPMALTFIFAMLGVMILCLTYVPMMSAWFIRINKAERGSFGNRLLESLEAMYSQTLEKALKSARWVLLSAVVLLGIASYAFSRLGGEFIPQLDEGSIAFHIILKPGSSLTESIASSTKIEKILLEEFPEIKNIMSRFGVADVPTDPMPMDLADCFVILKPKDEWVSAKSKDELIELMKAEISQVPGVSYEFTQPIEMRFNELITGVREDLAVKIYGEDLDILAQKAEEIGALISSIKGVGDYKVEATSGLPQVSIHYHRSKIAQYGLSIDELNKMVQSAFSGGKAGVIYEGEKRFDLVVRLDKQHRSSIDDIKDLFINLPSGNQIPLRVLADISFQPGPMQISRDNTNRRAYVGVNVRGRDIKSLVSEIENRIDEELEIPPGYYIRYGGAFENLERASQRLQIVVPIALGLIFLLIFLALRSYKQSLMIFMAIPLAAIGGVFSLWIRDMPFSISAGVGFIVLFGVAVLNGLVLISGWNELKQEGITDLEERIQKGSRRRLRPIMLTALTDILGFLPMAVSGSAGAEVQRPLATVVIGGMITATLLTLFVLPILYRWVEGRENIAPKASGVLAAPMLLLLLLIPQLHFGQTEKDMVITSLDQALEIGLNNNGNVSVARTNIQLSQQAEKAAFNPEKTSAVFQYGQYNSFEDDFGVNLNQRFNFPTAYSKQRQLAEARTIGSEIELKATENDLQRGIKYSWYQLSYLYERKELLLFQDSIFAQFLRAATIRYQTEESSYLEMVAAETRVMEVENSLKILESNIAIQQRQLRILLNDTLGLRFIPNELEERLPPLIKDSSIVYGNPELALALQRINIAGAEKKLHSSYLLPGISVGYFNQSFIGNPTSDGGIATASDRFSGIQAGLTIPLFFGSYKANIESAKLKQEMAQTGAEYMENSIKGRYQQQLQEIIKHRYSLDYYHDKALPQADLILENAQKAYQGGAIGYVEYFQNMNQGLQLKFDHLSTLNKYNQSIIELEYLLGQ